MKRTMRVIAGFILTAWASMPAAQATTTEREALVAAKIAANFTRLAGSEENALALVNALRSGDMVRLVAATHGMEIPDTTAFETTAGAMEWKAVRLSLTRAQDSLARAGIRHPTAEQLQAALLGGDVTDADGTTRTLTGVLPMHVSGSDRGELAHSFGAAE